MTINDEPLVDAKPNRRRRLVPKAEVLAIFSTSTVIDCDEMRADLDSAFDYELRDPFEGTES